MLVGSVADVVKRMLQHRMRPVCRKTAGRAYLVRGTALVRPEHDGVRGVVLQLLELDVRVCGEELEVRAAARDALGNLQVILEDETLGGVHILREAGGNAVVASLLRHLERDSR